MPCFDKPPLRSRERDTLWCKASLGKDFDHRDYLWKRLWSRVNTIRVPILNEHAFVADALAFAKEAEDHIELEELMTQRLAERQKELYSVLYKTSMALHFSKDKLRSETARSLAIKICRGASLDDCLQFFSGCVFGWEDEEPTQPEVPEVPVAADAIVADDDRAHSETDWNFTQYDSQMPTPRYSPPSPPTPRSEAGSEPWGYSEIAAAASAFEELSPALSDRAPEAATSDLPDESTASATSTTTKTTAPKANSLPSAGTTDPSSPDDDADSTTPATSVQDENVSRETPSATGAEANSLPSADTTDLSSPDEDADSTTPATSVHDDNMSRETASVTGVEAENGHTAKESPRHSFSGRSTGAQGVSGNRDVKRDGEAGEAQRYRQRSDVVTGTRATKRPLPEEGDDGDDDHGGTDCSGRRHRKRRAVGKSRGS